MILKRKEPKDAEHDIKNALGCQIFFKSENLIVNGMTFYMDIFAGPITVERSGMTRCVVYAAMGGKTFWNR